MVYFIQQRRYVSYHHHQYYHRSDAVSFRGVMLSMLLLVLLFATSTTTTTNAAAETTDSAAKPNPLECELYIADSTIPGAGTGIFSGVAKDVGDLIGVRKNNYDVLTYTITCIVRTLCYRCSLHSLSD